jgi:outer membrane protein, multidrug efflux system
MLSYRTIFLGYAVGATLCACSLAPPYTKPSTPPIAPVYAEAGSWIPAHPADTIDRDPWWEIYRDPQLDALERQAAAGNFDLQAELSRLEQARAQVRIARAGSFPQLDAGSTATRYSQSLHSPLYIPPTINSDYSLEGDFSYEIDVWGRIRNGTKSAEFGAQASAADLAALDLAVHAEVASDYFSLHGEDAQQALLDRTVADYRRALELTEALHQGGLVPRSDVDQANAQLQNAVTESDDLSLQRKETQHALAVLLGESASLFHLEAKPLPIDAAPPPVDPGLPSTLLERRPDIAAAERRVAAANAEVGVARAAYFPVFGLASGAGLESDQAANWLSAPSMLWSFGPSVALSLFDGGRRRARTLEARAAYEEDVARYRGTVVAAYRDVEDSLAALQELGLESASESAAVIATTRALEQSREQYRAGLISYLQVVVTENAALAAQLSAADIAMRRMNASIALVKALGGGWRGPRA